MRKRGVGAAAALVLLGWQLCLAELDVNQLHLDIGPVAFRNADDELVKLDEPGKIYLVDFMAMSCKPCMDELPELIRLSEDLASTNRFELVLVMHGWRGKSLNRVRQRLGLESIALWADTEGVSETLAVEGWPTKYLLRDGAMRRRQLGAGSSTFSKWKSIVEEEMKAESP